MVNATADETISTWIVNYNGTNVTGFTINTSLEVEDGNHHLFLYGDDSAGNWGLNDSIYFSVDTLPRISFTNPTPDNGTTTKNNSIEINVSITNADDLNEVIYNWNGTNYTIYNDSLVLMMNFDNISALGENDTYVVDVSGYGNDGDVYFGAKVNTTDCKHGNCFTLDGVDDFINVSYVNLNTVVGEYNTIIFWMYWLGGAQESPIEWGGHASLKYDFIVFPGVDCMGFNTGFGDVYGFNPSSPSLVDKWVHVTLVAYNGAYTGKNKIYINGVEQTLSQCSGDAQSGYANITMQIGKFGSQYWFNGSIDELRVWNRNLSTDEVQQQYFSNLNKYDTDKWLLYVNQSKNSTAGLDNGTYTYQAFAEDLAGNSNQTEERTINIVPNSAPIMQTSRIDSVSNTTVDNLQGYCNATDANEDKLSYFYKWYKNDTLFSFGSLSNYTTNVTQVSSLVNTTSTDDPDFVYVLGDYAYITDDVSDSLIIIDISTPSSPTQVGYLANSGTMNRPKSVFVSGDYAYVASYNNDSLTIINISIPSSPTQIGYLENSSSMNYAFSVYVSGDYAYVASYSSDSLTVIDVSTPTSPKQVGYFTNTSLNGASSVYVSGDYAYVASSLISSLTIIDISTPTSPKQVGYFANTSSIKTAQSVFVSGDYAYVASGTNHSLTVIDVSTPTSPTQIGYFTNTSLNGARSVFVSGDYAYVVSRYSESLTIIDIADGFAQGMEINVNNIPSSQLSAGDWILSCKAYDNTNYSSWLNSSSLTILDVTPPIIQVQSPTNTTYITSTIWFNATADETIDTWIVNYNGTNITHTINTQLEVENGNHHLLLWGNDSYGNVGLNDSIYFSVNVTYPNINFSLPTPPNDTITTNTSIEINVSIEELYLDEVIYNWNGTNYTMYNDSLVLMMNFDNVSALGENDTYVVDVSGYGNNGTFGNLTTGNINYTTGKYGLGIEFDKVDDYVNFSSSVIDFSADNAYFSVSVWIKTTHDDSDNYVLGSDLNLGWYMRVDHSFGGNDYLLIKIDDNVDDEYAQGTTNSMMVCGTI